MRGWWPVRASTPAFRLMAFVLVAAACASVDVASPVRLGTLGALCALAVAVTPGGGRGLLRRAGPLAWFALVGAGLVLAAPVTEATPALRVPGWPYAVSEPSALFLASLWTRCALLVAWSAASVGRFSEYDLLLALNGLPIPSRAAALCFLMLRSVGGVSSEVGAVLRAARCRGHARGLRALRASGAMGQALILRLSLRAETQAMALVARGFRDRLPLTEDRPIRPAEVLAALLLGSAVLWLSVT